MTANENEFAPVTPGEMLREEFLAEYAPLAKSARQSTWYFAKPDCSKSSPIVGALQQILLSASACTSAIVRSSG